MARSRSITRSAVVSSMALASVAVPTIAMAPAANAAEEPITAETSGFTHLLSADSQTTPFVQQNLTTEIKLPTTFTQDWNLRTTPDNGATYTNGTYSYTRSDVLAYQTGTIDGVSIAKFTNKNTNTYAEIGATGPEARINDGTIRQPILISVGNMHRTYDVTATFNPNGTATAQLPAEAINAAKAQPLDLTGTTITFKTSTSNLSSHQEIFPAICWTPSANFANTIDLTRSKGIVRVGDTFVIPAGVAVEDNGNSKTAKLPATIAFKGKFNGSIISPELKVTDDGYNAVATTLSGIVGTYDSATGATKYSDYATPIFGTYSDTFDWSVAGNDLNTAAFGGQVSSAFGSPFVGVAADYELGTMEAGCLTHTKELAQAHTELFGDSSASASSVEFSDINENSAFAADILWAANKGIVRGYADGTFRPEANISREAMAAFLYRMAGSPAYKAPATSPFKDVPTFHPFYTEIAWLAEKGISTGYADGTFRPSDSVKRDAMAAFFYRFAGSPAYTAPTASAFKDINAGDQFYKEVSWLASTGITTGWADGSFRPVESVQRNAMAAFIHRYESNVAAIG